MDPAHLDELDTPCLTVDLDAFERNVRLCLSRLAGVHVRPHLKTAKSPEVARLLLDAGAVGVCVAKLSEAEVMLAGGIEDVLITTEIAGAVKVRRLARLVSERPAARVRIVVDSWEGASAIDAALPGALETLIEVNVGQNRCGVAPEDALTLADRIRGLERLRLVGLQGYEGQPAARARRRGAPAAVRRVDGAVGGGRGGAARRRAHDRRRDDGRHGNGGVLRRPRGGDRGPARVVRVHGRRLPGHGRHSRTSPRSWRSRR